MTPEEIGPPPQAIESIRQVLGHFPGVEQAVLYGSRAKGNYRPGSDIDLTLKGDLSYRELLDIELVLDDFRRSIIRRFSNISGGWGKLYIEQAFLYF